MTLKKCNKNNIDSLRFAIAAPTHISKYDYNLNFADIEFKIYLDECKELEKEKELKSEIEKFNQIKYFGEKFFHNISSELFNFLLDTKNFSIEKHIIENLLKINENKIKNFEKNYCYITFTSQIITNWILNAFNTNFIDKSFIYSPEKILFNRYELINKISQKFRVYLLFYNKDYTDLIKEKNEINHLIFTLLELLTAKNILHKEIKYISEKNYKKTITTSEIFFTLINYEINLNNNNLNFNIFLTKPKIKKIKNKYFLGGVYYYTFDKIFKSNIKSNKTFRLSDMDLINKISSLKYTIDFNFYNKIYDLICKNLNIENNGGSLEKFLKENIKNISNNKILINEEKQTKEEIEDSKKIFQQKYSKFLEYYLFLEIKKKLKNTNSFYLGIHFDFRGRLYPKSCISPTGPKIIRFLYNYGYYSENELKETSIKIIDNKYKTIIENCLLLKIFNNINLNNNTQLYYFYICLFEIGKIFKNELSFLKNGILNNEDILLHGNDAIDKIYKNLKKLSFDEELEYIYILSALEDLNKGTYKKLIIYKDATASGIQLLTVAHGCKNENITKNCNLRSYDMWYDTYYYIINIFSEKNTKELKEIAGDDYNFFITRKNLKRSIMTYIYGAGIKTALNYYLENLPKKLSKEKGIKIFKLFYKFLDSFFSSNEFFEQSINTVKKQAKIEQEKNKSILIKTTDYSTIRLDYYKYINYRIDRIIEKKRSTIKYKKIDINSYDENKTIRALMANIAQTLDALFLRLIIKELKYPIITIHDSFGIDILNVDELISIANISINKISYSFSYNFKSFKDFKLNNYYSIHILL